LSQPNIDWIPTKLFYPNQTFVGSNQSELFQPNIGWIQSNFGWKTRKFPIGEDEESIYFLIKTENILQASEIKKALLKEPQFLEKYFKKRIFMGASNSSGTLVVIGLAVSILHLHFKKFSCVQQAFNKGIVFKIL